MITYYPIQNILRLPDGTEMTVITTIEQILDDHTHVVLREYVIGYSIHGNFPADLQAKLDELVQKHVPVSEAVREIIRYLTHNK